MKPLPKPYTTLERIERWFRKRRRLKQLTRTYNQLTDRKVLWYDNKSGLNWRKECK